MIMKETYLETLKDAVLNTQDSYFKNKKKEEILADESLLDKAAYDFQKNHEEFGCDYDWSLNEALSEILKIEVPGHNICISPELDRRKRESVSFATTSSLVTAARKIFVLPSVS